MRHCACVCVCVCVSPGFIGLHKAENELMIPVNCQAYYTIYVCIYCAVIAAPPAASPPRLPLLPLLLICRTFIRANY